MFEIKINKTLIHEISLLRRYWQMVFLYYMFLPFSNMKSRSTINVNAARRFSHLLRHFIDEDTVSFDIFKLDGKEEKSVMPNGSSASSNKTHFLQIDHQQNNQTNGNNNNSNLFSDGLLNKENSFETFKGENESASNKNFQSHLKETTLKR